MTEYTDKICKRCGIIYTPTGRSQRFCPACGKIRQRESVDRYRKNHGAAVGIGSGNLQDKERNHQWKGGVASYTKLKISSLSQENYVCERCHKDLSHFIQNKKCYAQWVVHHKDYNQDNNTIDNLELLCKRCHQLEHDCESHLPNKV